VAKIMIVDDSQLILAMATQSLTAAGHQVLSLLNGDEIGPALVAQMPDLIILDYFMPRLTGRDLYNLIRSDARGQAMAIIFMTAKPAGEIKPLFQDPRLIFLQKPVHETVLLQAVNRALGYA
jgi:CheY-like chemotaxis protein